MPRLLVVPQGSEAIETAIPILGRRQDIDVFVSPDFATALDSIIPSEYHGVLTLGSGHSPGLLELMVRCDGETPALPFIVELDGSTDLELPIEAGRTIQWLGTRSEPRSVERRVTESLDRGGNPQRRRGADYFLAAILCQRSVTLDLSLADGEQIQVEIVGGDIWNAYSSRGEAMDALEPAIDSRVLDVGCRALNAIPGERQIHHRGTRALARGGRRAVRDDASAGDKSPDVITQEITMGQVKAGIQQQAQELAESTDPFLRLMTEGIEASLARDYARAAERFEAALALRPDDPGAKFNLKRIQRHLR